MVKTMKENKAIQVLPLEIQNEVLEILKYWSGCYVMQNEKTGVYSVDVGIGITSRYNPNKCVASFKNDDIYTAEEIVEYNKNCSCEWF